MQIYSLPNHMDSIFDNTYHSVLVRFNRTYVFNPDLALKVEGEWINIYDLLVIDWQAQQSQDRQDKQPE